MSNFIYIATSLDGYIARKDGDLEWLLNIETHEIDGDYGYDEFLKNIDAIVMGRGTFDFIKQIEPWVYQQPVYVLSTSMKEIDIPLNIKGKIELLSNSPEEIVRNLKKKNLNNLYIDGGKAIQSFLKAGLIDEMIITRIPILLGSGIPLFGELSNDILWKHKQTITYENGLVKSHYCRKI